MNILELIDGLLGDIKENKVVIPDKKAHRRVVTVLEAVEAVLEAEIAMARLNADFADNGNGEDYRD